MKWLEIPLGLSFNWRMASAHRRFIAKGFSYARSKNEETRWSRVFGASEPSLFSETAMLHYAIVFLVIALIAAVLGFGGIAGAAAGIAKILFVVFLVLFIVSLIMGRRTPRV
jgi:uncharacterized membrane protein YtjA (UPF0391 family)